MAEVDDKEYGGAPPVSDPQWEEYSLSVGAMLAGDGLSAPDIIANRPKPLTSADARQCIAYLELSGVAMFIRGVWRLSPYGYAWLRKRGAIACEDSKARDDALAAIAEEREP